MYILVEVVVSAESMMEAFPMAEAIMVVIPAVVEVYTVVVPTAAAHTEAAVAVPTDTQDHIKNNHKTK